MADEAVAAAAATTTDSAAAPAPEAITTILTGAEGTTPEAPKPEGETQTLKDGEPKAPVVPEKYEFKVPEGMTLNAGVLEQFEPIAKELGLGQDQAQKVVDLYAGIKQAEAKAQADAWVQQVSDWRQTIEKDPEIGGQKLNESIKVAQSAIARFAPPELKAALEQTGLGNHPALVKFCVSIGRAMAEQKIVSAPPADTTNPALKVYPTMTK